MLKIMSNEIKLTDTIFLSDTALTQSVLLKALYK